MPEKGWKSLTVKEDTKKEFREKKPEDMTDDGFLQLLLDHL